LINFLNHYYKLYEKVYLSIYLFIYLYIYLSISLNGQVIQSNEIEKGTSIQRNASYNLDEIKVRWKKAALENCLGVPCAFTCGTSTVSDVDGNAYTTVLIGAQCWTKENLKVTRYNDLTAIPLDATGGSTGTSLTWQNLTTGSYTIYGNESSTSANATNYGILYNWYAAKGIITSGGTPTKNMCPTGWHVPTDSDWNKLVISIDSGADTTGTILQSTTAGILMKKNDVLWTPNTGTNTSGFSVLPGGFRDSFGFFNTIRNNAFFWSATEIVLSNAWSRSLNSSNGVVSRNFSIIASKSVGASVRCLRN
jgi:uncharacterized protein (TIGR02145 family)